MNFSDIQNIPVENYVSYIDSVCLNNKVSHAYLIELNDCEKEFSFVTSFVKMILFPCAFMRLNLQIIMFLI